MSPAPALLWVVVGIALLVIMNLKYKVHNIFRLINCRPVRRRYGRRAPR